VFVRNKTTTTRPRPSSSDDSKQSKHHLGKGDVSVIKVAALLELVLVHQVQVHHEVFELVDEWGEEVDAALDLGSVLEEIR
jgi:hypothetical protein